MNALTAYQRGATGKDVVVGIVDSGIDLTSAEFTGRIAASSADVAGNSSVQDVDGHGTAVAFTLAGRRNGTGTHGVAFDAQLAIFRADSAGSCGSSGGGCLFSTDAIARGVDAARLANAKVINLSLGGSSMPQDLIDALARATAAGIVVVIAAGNDGDANPDAFAMVATNAVARNQIIIAGSVDLTDTIGTTSNRAGAGAAQYLAAVGEQVRAPNQRNQAFIWSGTSFAAPQISGAVALLAQAFPNLTGAQIVEILFRTARDAGAAGNDAIYGNGVLDLTRAFQPVGTITVAGSRAEVSSIGASMLSSPMGDATASAMGAVVLDGYSRAYAMDLATNLARSAPPQALALLLQPRTRNVAFNQGGMALALTVSMGPNGTADLAPTMLRSADVRAARSIAGTVQQRFGSTSLGFGIAQGTSGLTDALAGRVGPSFLLGDAATRGLTTLPEASSGLRQQMGRLGVTLVSETGDVVFQQVPAFAGRDSRRRAQYNRTSVSFDRQFGPLSTQIAATRWRESATALGARFATSLGAPRATSWFLDADARLAPGGGWSIGGSMRQGWTSMRIGNGLSGSGSLRTIAFAADFGKQGVFGGDSIGLRVAEPLRVASGGLDLVLPTGWDYTSGSVSTWERQRLNLAPTGREIDVEARYSRVLGTGTVQTNFFWRSQPGNQMAIGNDYGMALRYAWGF